MAKPERISWRREEEDLSLVQQLGQRLRAVRETKGMSLSEAAQVCGLLPSTLSRIENSKMSPTFSVLARVMAGLECDWLDLLGQIPDETSIRPISVVRCGQGQTTDVPGLHYSFLHDEPSALSQTMIINVSTKRLSEVGGLVGHPGEEFCYVLRGDLELHFEGQEPQRLAPGDSALFDSRTPHAYVDKSGKETQILVVLTRESRDREPQVIQTDIQKTLSLRTFGRLGTKRK